MHILHCKALSALRQAASCKKLIETDRHKLPASACLDVPMMCMSTPLHVVLKTKTLTCLEPLQQQPPVCNSPIRFFCSGYTDALSISNLLCRISHQHTESSSSGCLGGASRGSNAASACPCSSGHLCRQQTNACRGTLVSQRM